MCIRDRFKTQGLVPAFSVFASEKLILISKRKILKKGMGNIKTHVDKVFPCTIDLHEVIHYKFVHRTLLPDCYLAGYALVLLFHMF